MNRDIITLDGKLIAAFIAAAEELHFGRAAARMFMSQPPFSQLIKRVETIMGADLFERTTRSVRLTPAGQVMFQHVQKIASDLDLMAKAVHQASRGEGGTLTIGLTPTAACSPLAEKLYSYRLQHSNMELDLREMNSNAMEAALRLHSIDIALMRPMLSDADIEVADIFEERLVLAVRKDNGLANSKSISLNKVADLDLIGYSPTVSPYFSRMMQGMFAGAGRKPRIIQESVIPTLLTLVEAGVGVAIVPWTITRSRGENLSFLSLTGAQVPKAKIIAATLTDRKNPAIDGFISALQSGGSK